MILFVCVCKRTQWPVSLFPFRYAGESTWHKVFKLLKFWEDVEKFSAQSAASKNLTK